jgi:succinate dehydrogenase/fumarate reductase flavoprotein subunit
LARNPVEFELFSGAWSSTGSPKGVLVDAEAQTDVHGLFAAGDLATPVYALSGSLTSGYVAGAAAARFAYAAAEPVLDPLRVAAERDRVLAPLTRTSGISWREYERELQATMTAYVGMDRNDTGLQQAAEYLSGYRAAGESVSAGNGHELMRAHEAFDLALFDEMMIAAARERDESRANFVMRHYRTDHPRPDDQTWAGVSVDVSHDGVAPKVKRTIPTPSWRTAKLAAAAAATRSLAQTGAT